MPITKSSWATRYTVTARSPGYARMIVKTRGGRFPLSIAACTSEIRMRRSSACVSKALARRFASSAQLATMSPHSAAWHRQSSIWRASLSQRADERADVVRKRLVGQVLAPRPGIEELQQQLDDSEGLLLVRRNFRFTNWPRVSER